MYSKFQQVALSIYSKLSDLFCRYIAQFLGLLEM